MGQPKDRRKYLWTWALAGTFCLAAGAIWAGGVVYVSEGDESEDAFLGVTLTEEIDHPEGGARVLSVIDDSPAEEAGIEDGDIIQGFDGAVVRGPGALSRRLEEKEPGDQVSLRLLRDGREMSVDVELGEHSSLVRFYSGRGAVPLHAESWSRLADEFGDEFGEEFSETWTEWADELDDSIHVMPHLGGTHAYFLNSFGRPKLGVQLSETTPELREHFGADSDTGVLISKVLPDMPAADAGLRVGDLIVAIDGEPVARSGEIVQELRDKEGMTFPIEVIRDGRSVSIDVSIPERKERDRSSGPRAFLMPSPARLDELTAVLESLELPELPELPELLVMPELPELPVLPTMPALPALPEPPSPPAPSGARELKIV